MNKAVFEGVCTALVTPFDSNGKLDMERFEVLLRTQLQGGTNAVLVCGTTGESPTLSDREKETLFNKAVDVCKGKIPVIAGVGSNDTAHSCQMAKMAQSCGVDALLVVTPYYNKTSQNGALQHYSAIASSVSLPILLYNIPSRTGMNLLPETVAKLARIKNIVGIKEASGNLNQILHIRALCPDDFSVYAGNDSEALLVLALGGKGIISVASNLIPNVVHCLYKSFCDGELLKAQIIQMKLLPLIDLLFETVNPVPVKILMKEIGLDCGNCRLPLEQPDEKLCKRIAEAARPLLAQDYLA